MKRQNLLLAFNNERPTSIGISGSVGSMPNRVMNKTFGITPPDTFFRGFNNNSPIDIVIGSKRSNIQKLVLLDENSQFA